MFIYKKENVLSPELCHTFIKTFEASNEKSPGVLDGPDGKSSSEGKKSTDITFNPSYLEHNDWGPLLKQLIPVIEKGQNDYIQRYFTALSVVDQFRIYSYFNMQRYLPNEGFSSFHCERGGFNYLDRILVWMIYLNDVTDGGETEFYYQHHFEPAQQGKLIIWPSDWMFLHRGIPSPTQTKYILTGWFTHIENKENK
jgi:hypothetical protein